MFYEWLKQQYGYSEKDFRNSDRDRQLSFVNAYNAFHSLYKLSLNEVIGMKRFVHLFKAKDRMQAMNAINEYAVKKNLTIVSVSMCIDQGEYHTMVVFEKNKEE